MLSDIDVAAIEKEIPRLRRFARARVGDADLADDLVQDCLERAIRKFDQFQRGTNLRAWLITILKNLQINHYRKTQRRPNGVDIDDVESECGLSASQGHSIEAKELMQHVQCLAQSHRDVLMLVAVEGYKYEEAAEILGVPTGTIRSRLCRARQQLRDMQNVEAVPVTRQPARYVAA